MKDRFERKNSTRQTIFIVMFLFSIIAATPLVTSQNQLFGQAAPGSVLKLSRASVPIDIPLVSGFENGNEIFFIATDVSDEKIAEFATNLTGFKVNFAPVLAQTPESALSQAYVFKNGVEGKGPYGFQVPVLSGKPGDEGYSPLLQVNMVEWKQGSSAKELKSVQEIMDADNNGTITINQTDIVVNHPAIKWNGGEMKVREDKKINDDSHYGGAQVLNIDTENMVVTMVAHRGWGPDGKSIYYIVTDATPEMPANMMGVVTAPADELLAGSPVAVDLFQFMNGINGTGPMGFQAGIGAANPTDKNYSPMWKISFGEWKDPSKAMILETLDDIKAMGQNGMLTVTPAMEGKHIVNCPFFDQSTVFKHENQAYHSS